MEYAHDQEPMEVDRAFGWERPVEAPMVLIVAAKQKPRRTEILRGFATIAGGDGGGSVLPGNPHRV